MKIVSLGNDFNSLNCQSWANLGASYAIADDRSTSIWSEFGSGAIPRNVIIDSDGVVHYSSIGYNESTITSLLNDLLQTVAVEEAPIPQNAIVFASYPNPFNGETNIQFELYAGGLVDVTIYNTRGIAVRNLLNQNLESGSYNLSWNGRDQQYQDVPSGVYMLKLRSPSGEASQKLLLLK